MMPPERPPGIRRADHVGFSVASLDEALRFWIDGLGARLVRTGEMGGTFIGEVTGARGAHVRFAVVSLCDATIELLEYADVARPASPSKPFDPGFAHLAFAVDDVDAVLARVAPYGWKPPGTPQRIAAGPRAGTKTTYVLGPDGACIELLESPS